MTRLIPFYAVFLILFACKQVKDSKNAIPYYENKDSLVKNQTHAHPKESTIISITAKNFNEVKYTKVVAYTFNIPRYGEESEIIYKGKLNPSAKLPGRLLNDSQIKLFIQTINDPKTYGGEVYDCFLPRMGVVFYNKDNIVSGYISICFQCNQLNSNPSISAIDMATSNLDFGGSGFSKPGRKKLQNLCENLGLEECSHK